MYIHSMNFQYIKMYKTGLYFITAGSQCSIIDFVVHPDTYALGEKYVVPMGMLMYVYCYF